MRTYKLTIAYDGTNYQGWQRQSDTDRTIQGILEETLENCIGYQVQIDGSGRTDAGVHASGQTASVVLPGKVDTALFTEKMNGKEKTFCRAENPIRSGMETVLSFDMTERDFCIIW